MTKWDDWFYYDETSPSCLRWKVSRTCGRGSGRYLVSPNDVAGSVTSTGHWLVRLNGKPLLVHRVIYEMLKGDIPEGLWVDHENKIRSDNKIDNLRVVTPRTNNQNSSLRSSNTSGVTGVSLQTDSRGYESWVARWVDGDGVQRSKHFSVRKYGVAAFILASNYRDEMINKLNECGMQYTDQHGKEV